MWGSRGELVADRLGCPLAGSDSCRSRCGTRSGNGRTTILEKDRSTSIRDHSRSLTILVINDYLTRIISSEPQYDVTVVRDSDRVLGWGQIVLSVQQTSSVQVEGVLQVDLLHVGVGRPTNTDNVERVSVQMERMTQIGLLDCKDRTRSSTDLHLKLTII